MEIEGRIWVVTVLFLFAFFISYNGSIYAHLSSDTNRPSISELLDYNTISLGGSLQVGYHYYFEDELGDNRFDVRKARLALSGTPFSGLHLAAEFEFQGNENNKLLKAFIEAGPFRESNLRLGQFKEPFGLEAQADDKAVLFADRSIGYSLTPQYDVGMMSMVHFYRIQSRMQLVFSMVMEGMAFP